MTMTDLVKQLLALGASPEIMAVAVEALESASMKRPRGAGAERMARKRERDKASQSVTCDVTCVSQVTKVSPLLSSPSFPPKERSPIPPKETTPLLSPPILPPSNRAALGETAKTDIGPDYFPEAWEAYPKAGRGSRCSKREALTEWSLAVKRAGSSKALLVAVKRFAATPDAKAMGEDGRSIVMGMQRWLKKDRFEAFLMDPSDGGEPKPIDEGLAKRRATDDFNRTGRWNSDVLGPKPEQARLAA